MQLKSLAAFSASAFVSKRAGVASWFEWLEHPINKNEKVIKIEAETDLNANTISSFTILTIKS